MVNKLSPLLIGLGLVALSSLARADDFDYQIANILLLQNRGIQKDMGVDEAQRGRLNQVADWFNTQQKQELTAYQAATKKNPKAKPDAAKIASMQTDFKKKVMAQLSPAQIKRLREVTIQVAGYSALTDKSIAARVGLSETQRKAVAAQVQAFDKSANALHVQANAIQKKAIAPVIQSFGNKKAKDAAETRQRQALVDNALTKVKPQLNQLSEKLNAAMTTFDGKVEKILTPAQIAAFKGLEGTPYKDA